MTAEHPGLRNKRERPGHPPSPVGKDNNWCRFWARVNSLVSRTISCSISMSRLCSSIGISEYETTSMKRTCAISSARIAPGSEDGALADPERTMVSKYHAPPLRKTQSVLIVRRIFAFYYKFSIDSNNHS